jgi:hypothetical protein
LNFLRKKAEISYCKRCVALFEKYFKYYNPKHGVFHFWRKSNTYKTEVVRVNPGKPKTPQTLANVPLRRPFFPEVGSSHEGIRYTSSTDPAQGYPLDRFEC